MGWFHDTFGFSSQDAVDAILPESVKDNPVQAALSIAAAPFTGGASLLALAPFAVESTAGQLGYDMPNWIPGLASSAILPMTGWTLPGFGQGGAFELPANSWLSNIPGLSDKYQVFNSFPGFGQGGMFGAPLPTTAQGGSMASILDWINPGNNLLTGGQPYNTGLDLASWLTNPSSISNIPSSVWSAGLPSTSWQQMGTAGLDIANLLGLGNLTTSGGGGTNTLWNLGKNILNQILGSGSGGGQQMPTGTNTGGFNLSGLLNSLIGGGGGGNSALGTIGPAAMLAYLNQKRFDYPSPSAIEWPTWMEQVRQGAMNPQEYGLASNKFQNLMNYQPTPSYLQEPAEYGMASQNLQNLMGTSLDQYKLPINEIMAAQRAQQDLDYQRWLKQVKPSIAGQGQLDSTYWANMMGEPLTQQGITSQQTLADLLTQESLQNMQLQQWLPQFRAGITGQQIGLGNQRLIPQQYNVGLQNQLQQWTPEFQSSMANQLTGLGSQISSSGQGWFGQGLGYTGLQNTPTQRGFELEYAKQAKAEEAKNQAEQLWSAILMGNMFPQNPVFNPRWGTGQTGGFNLGSLGF